MLMFVFWIDRFQNEWQCLDRMMDINILREIPMDHKLVVTINYRHAMLFGRNCKINKLLLPMMQFAQ